jgi:hypothetical protein
MAEYKWPDADKRTHIGKRVSRIDGPHKVSGRAKYCSTSTAWMLSKDSSIAVCARSSQEY